MNGWGAVSEAYRRSFAGLCSGTIDAVLAELSAGSLLDVGCGTGELSRRAAVRGWEVTSTDADADMVATTATVTGREARVARLPRLPLPDGSFDAVVANFVVNHVDRPLASVQEMARVLRPSGTVAMTIWPAGGAGWSGLVAECFAEAGVVPLPAARLPVHLDFPRTVDGLAQLAEQAGLRVRVAREVTWDWAVSPDDLWAGISGGVASVGQTFVAQSDEVQARVRAHFVERSQEVVHEGLLTFSNRAVLVVANA